MLYVLVYCQFSPDHNIFYLYVPNQNPNRILRKIKLDKISTKFILE